MDNGFNKSIYHKLTSQLAVGLSLTVCKLLLKINSAMGKMNGVLFSETQLLHKNVTSMCYYTHQIPQAPQEKP